MKAILPVAGVGSRLRPHTHTTPKALVHVAGKPILGHILDSLQPAGVDEIVLIVGYLGGQIVDYVKRTYDLKVHVVEQEERLGLGHAIYLAKDYVKADEPVLIILGDTIVQADLAQVIQRGITAIGVREVDNPSNFGVVQMAGQQIERLVEKPQDPPTNLAVVGVYYIQNSSSLFAGLTEIVEQDIKTGGELQLTDGLQMMIDRGERMEVFTVENWLDCGNPETLLAANRYLLASNGYTPFDERRGVIVIPPVYIDADADLGNCIVGPYVSIAADAQISNALIRDSIINEGAYVADLLLEKSLVGHRAVVQGRFSQLNIGDSSEITSKKL
ncbi:MAG: NTP transferase domain-containing protein [Firmicutes bacterium]|nr:NTP transferase domain-containing protein [Bacillota bacterium]